MLHVCPVSCVVSYSNRIQSVHVPCRHAHVNTFGFRTVCRKKMQQQICDVQVRVVKSCTTLLFGCNVCCNNTLEWTRSGCHICIQSHVFWSNNVCRDDAWSRKKTHDTAACFDITYLFRLRLVIQQSVQSVVAGWVRGLPWRRRVPLLRRSHRRLIERSRHLTGWRKRTNGCCRNKEDWRGRLMAVCLLRKNGWRRENVWGSCRV